MDILRSLSLDAAVYILTKPLFVSIRNSKGDLNKMNEINLESFLFRLEFTTVVTEISTDLIGLLFHIYLRTKT